jgi:hypothetical protein
MSGGARDLDFCSAVPKETRVHSHVTDGLPAEHPRSHTRVYCDRCEMLLHMQTNSCMRTWIESGRGNHCVRCFIVVAGGLAPDETRLAGVDCLSRKFALDVSVAQIGGAA